MFFDGHRYLQRIEGVETEPLALEERRVSVDIGRAAAPKVECHHEELLDFFDKRSTHGALFVVPSGRARGARHSKFSSTNATIALREPAPPFATRSRRKPRVNTLVTYTAEGGVATLTLNDPPANAYTHEMMKELDEAVLEARFDNDVHVIVITGHGERFFCAGANIDMLREVDPAFKYYFCLHANETLLRLEHTPKLVIAAINGHCVGGGLEIALACDLRVGRKGAGRLGLPEIGLGVLPGTGGTQRLARVIGKARAMSFILEAEMLPIEAGVDAGLLHSVYDASTAPEFQRMVLEYARRFVAPGRAPLAVGRIKRSVQAALEVSLEQGLALERELQAELFASQDAAEGLAAYAEKRAAIFTGT